NKYYLINLFSGEEEKNIDTCKNIWKKLIKLNADRNSIVINLGGGVITDMGGFACSVFKRGLNFLNIPTTLLSMIDASIGGKTAINFFSLKNEIGLFNDSKIILIDKNYLKTLSEDEIKSGFSEILKYGLIYDINLWNLLKIIVFSKMKDEIIYKSIIRKSNIIEKDYKEKGLRKILNFGHTIGHAIESYFIYNLNKRLSHGHSIAIGMICESWISYKMKIIKKTEFEEIYNVFSILYKKIKIYNSDLYKILYFMKHDKKNKNKKIKFSLIKEIGYCLYNIEVDYELIKESLKNYLF
ncbi:3-dehydroquinate synthase, partial [Candidatus Karelsulcia muelleri]|uniref:3-dehydroquinate synthase n=1 Tax=Candidatus Karelsulcia muelleri TaxID=336810 RepID=UPI00216AE536